MKIQYQDTWGDAYGPADLAGLIERELDGSDYERGAIEMAAATADNATAAIARLVVVLARKGVISADDALEIAGVCHATDSGALVLDSD